MQVDELKKLATEHVTESLKTFLEKEGFRGRDYKIVVTVELVPHEKVSVDLKLTKV